MKICIVTGGSGGHIYPAITFADYEKTNRHEDVVFIGNDHKMESWIVPDAGYPFYAIHNQGLQGSKVDKLKAVFSQFGAYRAAKKHLKTLNPDVVMAFGGYVSAPVSFAATKLKIPLIVHEQNAFPGKANKMVAEKAQAIITCYPEAFKDRKNVHYLGNPRASLIHETIDSSEELKRLNLDVSKPIVLMVMGSQGSTSMNKKFMEFAKNFNSDSYQAIITTGPLNIDAFLAEVGEIHPNLRVTGFVDQRALLPKLSLIVCRSGASTIAEIQSFGLPSLMIPSPHVANNHQYYNAKSLFDVDACDMLVEADIEGTVLDDRIQSLLNNPKHLKVLGENAHKLATPDAVSNIADLVAEVVAHAT
ncbi:UDP-N-acetylglucosamine--N-acetylmuramyl-(pentapeptide) pyrophosphoryl-undecaprenol N-acetylglucosamine transferase [Erysipelothrix sp. HDW6C]|uniref:UDP-N-acetylglucosamine--N-acetylmuramyl- (pentapeptide) pyrophosphoryl-undecaprenol N-acetylglucosamine transferase n=1 Tax=Erysipelothrix sp. HDW6C TaxID=2714930 RepID=UPI00140A1157|nr:UDP-N-acetylglucosamine--N-acetylmuramyl-(pentapeptide) pyrophosphoryl-undecaprenol N-acetylglucosamine transferase [Erysipelothrix sp. HDW6C]QIK70091.1 UDP-N-acetylglucosamine--N-acetylmuramyl-(pentapeptide) pyrophosphoryl-undecaprenol N-acetylglucosamine transferase [Erysipelothrix sp. HDW6C]